MAAKIELDRGWGFHDLSEREYETVSLRVERVDTMSWPERTIVEQVKLYVDEETGLVVQDIEKFEEWMSK